MDDVNFNSDFLRGHINTIILKSLFSGDKYGLEICKEIETSSNGTFILKQPSLYSALKRLEGLGLITSYWKDSDIGGKRHYYAITKQGIEAFNDNQDEWAYSRKMIDDLISVPSSEFNNSHLSKEAKQLTTDIFKDISEIKTNLNENLNSVKVSSVAENDSQFSFLNTKQPNLKEELDAFQKSLDLINYQNAQTSPSPIEETIEIINNLQNNETNLNSDFEELHGGDNVLNTSDAKLLENPKLILTKNKIENDGKLLSPNEKIFTEKELADLKKAAAEEEERKKALEIKKQQDALLEQAQRDPTKSDAVFIRDTYIPKTKAEEQAILNNIYFKSSNNSSYQDLSNSNFNNLKDKKENLLDTDDIAKNIIYSNLEDLNVTQANKKYLVTSYAKTNGAPAFSKAFIKYNSYNFTKNILLCLISICLLTISFVVFYNLGDKDKNFKLVYKLCAIVSILPFIYSLIMIAINPMKKKQTYKIKHNIIIEIVLFIIICAVIYAVNRLYGNTNILNINILPFYIAPITVSLCIFFNHVIASLLKKSNKIYA